MGESNRPARPVWPIVIHASPIAPLDPSQNEKSGREPYIDPKLQEGTTPLVKLMGGRATRNFSNSLHRHITEQDCAGPRAILDNRFKLVIDGDPSSGAVRQLLDLRYDPAERDNLVETKPEIARHLQQQLLDWQQSVRNSLTGADYRLRTHYENLSVNLGNRLRSAIDRMKKVAPGRRVASVPRRPVPGGLHPFRVTRAGFWGTTMMALRRTRPYFFLKRLSD